MPGSSALLPQHTSKQTKISPETRTALHVEVPQAYGVNILFRIGSIAITVPVAIAIFLAVAVVPAVLAVAVIVAVLLLFHVQSVDNSAQTGQTLVGVQLVDELVVVLMRIVGTAYVNADVGNACYELRVGDHADRGGVEHDIVVVFFNSSMASSRDLRANSSVGLGGMAPPGST